MTKQKAIREISADQKSKLPLSISSDRVGEDIDLLADPVYHELLIDYQNAEWVSCSQLIDNLLQRYPGKQILLDFKADIDIQLMLNKMSAGKSRSKIKKVVLSVLAFLALIVVVVLAVGYFTTQTVTAYQREAESYQAQLEQAQKENIVLLENQARSALQAGKPNVTLEILGKIEAQDPQYPALENLRTEAGDQLALIDLYDQARGEMSEENYTAALDIFNQIKAAAPLFRDVEYQIGWIENHQHVMQLVADGESAYNQKRWQGTIQAYEQAMALDASVNSATIKNQLLYSYLNSIIETLSRESHTIEELERSGTYYRKAIALIPQDRNYIAEREHLQSLSLELLVSKNYQMAKVLLADPNHTRVTVTRAINFLKYASELKPDNQVYKTELNKAQMYQSVLEYFDQGKMPQAIAGLEELARFDRQYPNGMGPVLLYEAYVAQGLKLHEDGFYLDARANFEQAELIAWENREIKMQLFLVQIDLGNSIGKLENYKDAVSYIEYAFSSIPDVIAKVDNEEISDALEQAHKLSAEAKYLEAYLAYQDILSNMEVLFSYQDVNVNGGDNLFYIAYKYQSTIQAIQRENEVEFPVITQAKKLSIPSLP